MPSFIHVPHLWPSFILLSLYFYIRPSFIRLSLSCYILSSFTHLSLYCCIVTLHHCCILTFCHPSVKYHSAVLLSYNSVLLNFAILYSFITSCYILPSFVNCISLTLTFCNFFKNKFCDICSVILHSAKPPFTFFQPSLER
jgi:hypothetical protein